MPINVFFVELIIVLMFFSISVAVVLRMFAAADAKAMRTETVEKSMLCVQSVSEIYSVNGDMKKTAVKLFGESSCNFTSDDVVMIFLDTDAKPLVVFDADIRHPTENMVKLKLSETAKETACGRYSELSIEVSYIRGGGEDPFYNMKCSAYIPGEGGAANEA